MQPDDERFCIARCTHVVKCGGSCVRGWLLRTSRESYFDPFDTTEMPCGGLFVICHSLQHDPWASVSDSCTAPSTTSIAEPLSKLSVIIHWSSFHYCSLDYTVNCADRRSFSVPIAEVKSLQHHAFRSRSTGPCSARRRRGRRPHRRLLRNGLSAFLRPKDLGL